MGIKKTQDANNEIRVGEIKGALGTNQVPSDDIAPRNDKWRKGPQISANKWTCVEVAMYGDTPYDQLYMWVDGTLVHSITSDADWQNNKQPANWLRDKFNYIEFGFQSYTGQQTADVWMDDIVVATAPIGCGNIAPVPSTPSSSKPSSSTQSSSASTSSTSPRVGDAVSGKALYESQCSNCHGTKGAGLSTLDSTKGTYKMGSGPEQSLAEYTNDWMPKGNPSSCVGQCGYDIAAYIRTWVATSSKSSAVNSSISSKSSSSVTSAPSNCGIAYGARSLRLLTKNEYTATVRDLLGVDLIKALGQSTYDSLPADSLINGFSNNVLASIESGSLQSYMQVATKVVDSVATQNFSGIIDCSGISGDQCLTRFVDGIGLKLFRRPLTTVERTAYAALFAADLSAGDNKESIKMALRTMLTSPQFLYRSEVGVPGASLSAAKLPTGIASDAYVLTPYELASFLSYTFAGTAPDSLLLTAASKDELASDIQVQAQVERLLKTASAREHFGNFAAQWLHTDKVLSVAKDATLYPSFTAKVRKAMAQEVRDIFNHVVLDQGEAFTTLFDGNFTFVNQDLASFYSISGVTGDAMRKVSNLTTRAGLVTSGAFLSVTAHDKETGPILRGVYARRNFMCHDVPPPPTGVKLDAIREEQRLAWEKYLAENNGKAASRKKYEFLTASEDCAGCHKEMINPLGGGFEDFNAVGLPQTMDYNKLSIDASGVLYGIANPKDGQSVAFTGAKEVAHHIASFDTTRQCFIDNSFRLAMGTGSSYFDREKAGIELSAAEQTSYSCEVEKLENVMISSDNSTKALLKALGSMESVRYRKNVTR